MSTIRNVEIALAKIIAGWSGKVLGTSIFHGQVPDGQTGCAVLFVAELPNPQGEPSLPHFSAQVVGKYSQRSDAQALLEALRTNLPSFGATQDGVIFPVILNVGEGAIVPDQDNGMKVWRFFYNLHVRWRD